MAQTVKTTGAVWTQFYADETAWPQEAYHDDVLLKVAGKEVGEGSDFSSFPADAEVEVITGYVELPDGTGTELSEHFIAWQKRQEAAGVVIGVFRVSADKLEAVRQAIVAAGGELV